MRLFYIDTEGDVISVTTTDDLIEAFKEFPDSKLKMAFCDEAMEARDILSQNMFDDTLSEVRSTRSERTYGSTLQRIGDLSRAQLIQKCSSKNG
jgi:hypothetical protein